jgi:hypothetical protein
MTSRFSRLINDILREYDEYHTKHKNYTDTYSREYLEKFVSDFSDWVMFQHCAEDREAMIMSGITKGLSDLHKHGRVVAEIKTTEGGKTTIRKIHSNRLEQQIEVDERRTAYEEGLDKNDIH